MKFATLHNFSGYLLSDPAFVDYSPSADPGELLLCELQSGSYRNFCSKFVTKPLNPLQNKGFVVSCTALVPKNPLRLITARTPHFADLYRDGTLKLAWYVDTLECGHQVTDYPFADAESGKKRHRCPECAKELALPQKKTVQSERFPAQSERKLP